MTTVASPALNPAVRHQYEWLPYPARNPQEERSRLLTTAVDELATINHYAWEGRRDLTKGLRVLIAGGGTGDSAVYLAHQLRNTPSELVYVDLSEASMRVARERALVRGLGKSFQWIHGSLLDLTPDSVGTFDYINCSGVLHHLPDPDQGLRTLAALLKPEGVMGLMVYGQYGRTGIYQMQEMLRRSIPANLPRETQLSLARQLISNLPPTNWFTRGHDLFESIEQMTPAEFYDIFLHAQDRAYTVPQLFAWLEQARLKFIEHTFEARMLYQPMHVFAGQPEMLAHVETLPLSEQQAICELFWGAASRHIFWASPLGRRQATPEDGQQIPCYSHLGEILQLKKVIQSATTPACDFQMSRPGTPCLKVTVSCDPLTRRLIDLIDGIRTVEVIRNQLTKEFQQSAAMMDRVIQHVCQLLAGYDLIVLRHASTSVWKF